MSSNSLQTSSALGLDSDDSQILVITTNDDANFHLNNRPTLPAELVSKIILELQQDRQYAVLAKMAQVSSSFYDLVIPKLYETVTITADNKNRISYGSHPSPYPKSSTLIYQNGDRIVDPKEAPYDNTKTRKDRAIEWCRRLIIDTPTEQLVRSVEYIADLLPHHRYGNVEELVFTRKATHGLTRIEDERAMNSLREEEDIRWLSKILGTRKEICDQSPKTKRVVVHAVNNYFCDRTLRHLSEWCKKRRSFEKPTQFAIHYSHRLSLVNFYYVSDNKRAIWQDRYFGKHLSSWLLSWIPNLIPTSWPHLKFYVDYRQLKTHEELSQDPTHASQHAKSILERDLGLAIDAVWDGAPGDKARYIRGIMDRMTLHDGEDEDEYSVSRPVPVAQLEVVTANEDGEGTGSNSVSDDFSMFGMSEDEEETDSDSSDDSFPGMSEIEEETDSDDDDD